MTFRDGLAALALLPLAACAGPKQSDAPAPDKLATLTFADGAAPAASPPSAANAYVIEFALERTDGSRFAAPRIVGWPGQVASISMAEDVSYVADIEQRDADGAKPGDPVTRTVRDGLSVEVCAQRAGDGGVTLGYSVSLAKLARPIEDVQIQRLPGAGGWIQLPHVTEVCARGTRWVEPGVQAMLARLAGPDGSGPVLVLARVTPVVIDLLPPAAGETAAAADSGIARPMTGHTVHLRVSAVRTSRNFEPGTVLDETATPDVLNAAGGEILRDFEAYTCLDGRVLLSATAGPPPGDRDYPTFSASVDDAGRVTITWKGRTACVRANPGRRFVAVAPVEGGGTAGVIVSVNADD